VRVALGAPRWRLAFYAEVDEAKRQLRYVNAFLLRNDRAAPIEQLATRKRSSTAPPRFLNLVKNRLLTLAALFFQ